MPRLVRTASNGSLDTGEVRMVEELTEFKVSNDAAELQRRVAEDGYLFFRKLQDPDQLRRLRVETLR